jgi:hypothetical protein
MTRVLVTRGRYHTPDLTVVATGADTVRQERPEPRLRWTDAQTAPGGDFAASAIPNAELDNTAVPTRGESWEAVSDFALSYDGYGYWDNLPSLAGRVLQRWTRRRSLPATLDELRGCLFYEQRRWHHFGEEPTGRSAEYMWAVIDAIAALTAPVASTVHRIPDPRRAIASETHVKLVVTRAVALRPLPSTTSSVRPLPARQGRLVPVPAAEAHVRLVSAIEDEASSVSRHPAGHASRRSSGRPAGNPAQHPSMTGSTRDLRPMPSADPLPKPPVIERRSRRATTGPPNRPGGAVHATRTSGDAWPANGSGWGLDKVPDDRAPQAPPAKVTPLCRAFHAEDAAYLKWVDTHPHGFVLNHWGAAASKAPTLHRVGCAAIAPRPGADASSAAAVRVCGPNATALEAWSVAQGTGPPSACRRCHP